MVRRLTEKSIACGKKKKKRKKEQPFGLPYHKEVNT